MAWIERIDKRRQRNKTWQDSENPNKFSLDATLAALHYESEINSDVFDTPIDATPVRVINPQFDGWQVTKSGWHYALGMDLANHGTQDGWVGFGGRQGQHWFKFRLAKVGYLHWPTRAWTDIGGAPTYKRQNLTHQTNTIEFATDGSTQPICSIATWADVWKTPVGGSLSVSWAVDGDRLKEEITINQAGREWIAANKPPTTPLIETYFGFVFQLDWFDIPKVYRQGILQDIEGDFADDGENIELKDALDRLLAFMPISDIRVPVDAESEELEVRQSLRKRFYKDTDGNYYLLLGVRTDILNTMPAGDFIFDPPINYQVGASSDDAYEDTTVIDLTGYGCVDYTDEYIGQRWTEVTIPSGATIDAATNDQAISVSSWDEPDHTIWFEDGADPGTFTTDASDISNRTPTTATATLSSADLGAAANHWISEYITLPELKTIIQELVDSYDYSGGAAMVCIYQGSASTARDLGVYTYDQNTTYGGKLHIEYTAAAATTLTVQDGQHTHSGDSPHLSQNQFLVVADGQHTQSGDSPHLSQDQFLVVADGQHTQSGDSPHLSQDQFLVVVDGEHTHSGDSPHLSQNQFLVVADGEHTHLADNIVLVYAGIVTLVVQDGEHTHSADSPHLSQLHILTVADGQHTHSGDSPHLSQIHILVVADGEHTHTGDSPHLSQDQFLVVADGEHTQTADSPHLSQDQFLVVADGEHSHLADNVILAGLVYTLIVQDGEHQHLADGVIIDMQDIVLVRPRSWWPFWSQ